MPQGCGSHPVSKPPASADPATGVLHCPTMTFPAEQQPSSPAEVQLTRAVGGLVTRDRSGNLGSNSEEGQDGRPTSQTGKPRPRDEGRAAAYTAPLACGCPLGGCPGPILPHPTLNPSVPALLREAEGWEGGSGPQSGAPPVLTVPAGPFPQLYEAPTPTPACKQT